MTEKILKPDEQMEAYSEAVKSGMYAKKSGLVGKYDNVRRYWEDETTRAHIQPFIQKMTQYCQSENRRIRIMDLGCGSADGFELLTGLRNRLPTLEEMEVDTLPASIIGLYKGVDLSEDLLEQAADIYGNSPKMQFEKGDFTKGLPVEKDEGLFDVYFSSFGTFSHHNDDRTAINLLAEIARRTEKYSLVICDWLGRYSYEWQTLWTNDLKKNRNMDYVVSYIYDKEERELRREELQHLTLRLMSPQEVERVVQEASKKAKVDINISHLFDRSIFTGRHMDTGDYNPYAQPMRQAVNSLHEPNLRTPFSSLIIDYVPKPGMDFLNRFFEGLQVSWNTLVKYVEALLHSYNEKTRSFDSELPPIQATYPAPLREMMARMRAVVEGVGWYTIGLPRENIIEPQLGYALRHLVQEMQQGMGCAHGYVGVLEIDKR